MNRPEPDDRVTLASAAKATDASLHETFASAPSEQDTVERDRQKFGNYEIIDEIARGGMGVVYRARQINADRIVALKLIRGSDPDPKELQRFQAEAKAAAKLDHPNIVPIYDVGTMAGEPFFAMKFVEGESLSQRLDGKPLDARVAAQLVRDVAAGIAHAHQHDIIHRDLKPGNVLLDASDTPLVTDFGLAKLSDEESDLTRTGQAIGTPAYMPPEQASGDRDKIDHCSDVYSLGAVLYACLTGRPPFQGSSAMATVMAVMKDEPVSPRLLKADVPKDIETICLKCLEKDSAGRYQSALDLRDDLGRFLSNQPILARPVSTYERTVKWVRRNPLGTGLVAAVVLALAGLTAAAVANSYSERLAMSLEEAKTQQALAVNSRNSAEEMRGQAERTNDETQRAIETIRKTEYANKIQFAQLGFENGDMGRASGRLKGTVESNRGWEFDYLTKKYKESFVPTDVLPPREYARRMTFAKDGKSLVSAMRNGDIHLELLRWPCSADQVIEFTLQDKNPLDPNERVNNVFFVDDRGERLIARTGLEKAYQNFLLEPDWESLRFGRSQEIQFPEPANMLATSETANLAICQQWTSDWTPIHSVGVIPLDQLIGQQVPAQEIQRAIVVEPKTWACPGQVMRGQFLSDGSRLYATAWDESGSKLFLLVYDTANGIDDVVQQF